MAKIKVLVVDDHPLVRFGIVHQLEKTEEYQIVGEASNGDDSLVKARKLHPDVILMDLFMPGLPALDAARQLKEEFPNIKILILTGFEKAHIITEVKKAGLDGFLTKTATPRELRAALKSVVNGELHFPADAEALKEQNGQPLPTSRFSSTIQIDGLTVREIEVLALVAEGLTNKEIADKLFISARTVDTHRTNIMQKLNIHDIPHLVRYAIDHNIIKN